jgi:hypothetical protein
MGYNPLSVTYHHKEKGPQCPGPLPTQDGANLQGTTPAVENSIIVVYGTIQGSYTYESTANWNITVPSIEAKYVDVVG